MIENKIIKMITSSYQNILLSGVDKNKIDKLANCILQYYDNSKIVIAEKESDLNDALELMEARYNMLVNSKTDSIDMFNKIYTSKQYMHYIFCIKELGTFAINSSAYKKIITIAKKGNNAGIHLFVSTSNIMESLSYGLYVNLPSQISVCECGENTAKIHFNLNNDDCVVNYDSFIKS